MAQFTFTNNTYAGEALAGFMASTLLEADSVKRGLLTVINDVKSRKVILDVDDDVVLQNPSGIFNDQGTTALQNESYLDPVVYEFMKQEQWDHLIQSWEAQSLKPGAFLDYEGIVDLSDFMVQHYLTKIQIANERLYWLGKGSTKEATFTAAFPGLLPTIAAASGVYKVGLGKPATSMAATAIDATGVVTVSDTSSLADGDVVTLTAVTGSSKDTTNGAPGIAVQGQSYFIQIASATTFKLVRNYNEVNSRKPATFLDKYNPDKEAIKLQVLAAGGWEKYKGQLYFFNPEVDDYPLIEADSVWEDFETEAGIKIFNNREVTTGFLPSTMLFMQSRREEADNSRPDNDELTFSNSPSQLEKDLGTFQGAKSAQKIIVIEYEDETSKPEFQPYSIQNNDKLFESTEKSVEARIIKGFSIPKELVNAEKSSGLSNGGEKKQAICEFNDNTAPDRLELSEAFEEIFSHFYTGINPANNWNIIQVPSNVADDTPGIAAGSSINQLVLANIPSENKIAILVYAYGFKKSEAEAMCL